MKLLFHCCCAPCAFSPAESLRAEGVEPTLFWYNPNIHPSGEYAGRRDSLLAFAAAGNFPVLGTDSEGGWYGLYGFFRGLGGETEAGKRCPACYRLRLERTAAQAAALGFDAFSTSLLISPYQNHDAIRETACRLADGYGVEFLYRDFRPMFRESQKRAREAGLYMQKYCGCIFSEADREAQKAGRR